MSKYVQLKRDAPGKVAIWVGDNSGASCGENRTEWDKVAVVDQREFAGHLLDLLQHKVNEVNL